MKHFIFFIVAIFASGVEANNVAVPNSFSADTPAVASEVNANFNAVVTGVNANDDAINNMAGSVSANSLLIGSMQSSVDTNATAIVTKADTADLTSLSGEVATNTLAIGGKADASLGTDVTANALAITALENAQAKQWIVTDKNGADLGMFLGIDFAHGESTISYISIPEGFVRTVIMGLGTDTPVLSFYTTPDCTGTLYTQHGNNTVFTITGAQELYSSNPLNPIPIFASPQSYSVLDATSTLFCNTVSSAAVYLWEAIPNVEANTGIPNGVALIPLIPVFK